MKTIETYRLPPTDFRGARCKATDHDGNSVVIAWNYSGDREAHKDACLALLRKMCWAGTMVGGHSKRGMVWVFKDGSPEVKCG